MITADVQAPEHRFNDDLLLQEDDRSNAAKAYPNFVFALYSHALCEVFEPIDQAANVAKKHSRCSGLVAIGMGTLTLLIASAEPAYHELPSLVKNIIGLAAAVLGILGVIIGVRGILYSGAKKQWLTKRFLSERLRQFHFQNLVMRLPELVKTKDDDTKREDFIKQSDERLRGFQQRFMQHTEAELEEVLKEESDDPDWLISPPEKAAFLSINHDADEFFRAYRDLRIVHQANYARYKLRGSMKLLDLTSRRQAKLLSSIGIVCIALLFIIHIAYAGGIALGWNEPLASWGHITIIWVAIIALAAKTLEEGLQPQRETERYENYQNSCRLVRDRFDAAKAPYEKFLAMQELERISYEEMKLFIRTNMETKFII